MPSILKRVNRYLSLKHALWLLPVALTMLSLKVLPRHLPLMAPTVSPQIEKKNTIPKSPQRPWFMAGGKRRPVYKEGETVKLFPEDAPDEDRVINQLMYALPESVEVPIKTILLADGLAKWDVSAGQTEFLRNNCPVDRCSLSGDYKDAATADAIIYKDHYTSFRVKRPHHQIWILYLLESPYYTGNFAALYNWTATYRRDSDIVTPYERWVYYDPQVTQRRLSRNFAAHKTRKVAWFVSNCHAKNKRVRYALYLMKYIHVDIFGRCGPYHCPRNDPSCLKLLDREYKFYLAFENSNCRDYITEKFFVNGLKHDVLPIVMGARPSEYAKVAPNNSYIHVEDFADPKELAKYLNRLDEDDDLYNSYFKWKETGEFINTFFFCRVCAMLHARERRGRSGHYSDVQAWWRNNACIRSWWRKLKVDDDDK